MAVTMKGIARDLGVSVVTVSKVLRNHSNISAPTRRRVLQRMQELNCHPNPAARALVTGRTNLLGLIVPDLVHPFLAEELTPGL
jgi:LacI family transcriptional regulator, galactose operon repressor